ncbi:MAG: phage capsid protein [Candidatus Thorarchaeota archaeon]|jgi:N4-gp56 family major capsid protein
MARMTTTTGDKFIPEIWSNEVIAEYEKNLPVGRKTKRLGHNGKAGDTIHLPQISNLVANDMSQTGEVSAQAITESEVQVLLNKWKESSFRCNDLLKVQSKYNLRGYYTGKAGYAIAQRTEIDILTEMATGAGASQDADGTAASAAGGAVTVAGVLKAIQTLDDNDVPQNDRCLVIEPAERNNMLQIAQFTSVDYLHQKPTVTGVIGQVFGVDVVVSTNLQTDANSKVNGWMFQKDGICLAQQVTPRTQAEYEQRFLSWLITVDTVYGVKTLRGTNIVRLVFS